MATSKKPGTTSTARPKKSADEGVKVGARFTEQEMRMELDDGTFIDVRISIGSVPKVGPGPRPKINETVLVRRIDEKRVLTISAEFDKHLAGGIVVGSGRRPPAGGGN